MVSSLTSYGGIGSWARGATSIQYRSRRLRHFQVRFPLAVVATAAGSKDRLQSLSGVVTDDNVPEGHSGLHGFLYGEAGADVHDKADGEFRGRPGEDDGTGILAFEDYVSARDALKFAGVYAVYDTNREAQYVGFSRSVVLALKKHRSRAGEEACAFVRVQLFVGNAMVSRARLDEERQRWLKDFEVVPPGNVEGSELNAVWEGSGDVLETKVMSENERKEYEEKKLKMRKAMGENLHDEVEGEDADAKTRRLNFLQAVEGDNWSAVIDGQSQETVANGKAGDAKQIVSPFAKQDATPSGLYSAETFDFTVENVDTVLNEVRPYLIADGGNVAVVSIDDGIVTLELQGACGSCPSSTSTMKMGIERVLREKFGEFVKEVVDISKPRISLTFETVNRQIDELRSAIVGYGGSVELESVDPLRKECRVKYQGPVPLGHGIKAVIKDKFPELHIELVEP